MSKKLLIILMLIVALSLSMIGVYANKVNTIPTVPGDTSDKIDNEGDDSSLELKEKVINIALFGIDTGREKYEAPHTDAIMILSIDKENKKIKLSSLMRDLYVDVEGYRKTRLNTAYTVGGANLAVKTINNSFDLDIERYITVDFKGLSSIIDAIGGVELEVLAKEIDEINIFMEEVALIKKEKPTPIKKAGIQTLNGNQAVSYARIRKVGDGDFERAERQNNVMTAIFKKLQEIDSIRYPIIAAKLYPHIKTSLTIPEILSIGSDILRLGIKSTEWARFPLDGHWSNVIINKAWYLQTDLDVTSQHIREFIYEE